MSLLWKEGEEGERSAFQWSELACCTGGVCNWVSSSCPRQLPPLQSLLGNTGFGTWTMLRKFSSFPRAWISGLVSEEVTIVPSPIILLMSRVYRYTGKDFCRNTWDVCGTSQKMHNWGKNSLIPSAAALIWIMLLPMSLNEIFSVILLGSSKRGINVSF